MDLPAEPGTQEIPDGYVRLYHQTDTDSLDSIAKEGLSIKYAKGIEGPRAIYAGETPFYGPVETRPTLEFIVPKEQWDAPFVLQDVQPDQIIAAHYPWHRRVRYIDAKGNASILQKALAGEFDDLEGDYKLAVQYVKDKYGEAAPAPEAQAGEVMFSRKRPGELFYSAMYDNIERNAQNVMPAEQWKTWLTSNGKKMGIKAEEVTWSGIMDWLSLQPARVKKEDVLAYIAMNNVNVNTVNLSEVNAKPTPDDYREFAENLVYRGMVEEPEGGLDSFTDDEYEGFVVENYGRNNFMRAWSKNAKQNATKHGDGKYVLPDGEDYEETVLLVPTVAPYKKDDSVHFGDVANGQHVGWLRHNVRKDANGEDVLFLEEIQSHRAQDALKFGFDGQRDADVDKFNSLVEKIAATESAEEKAKLQKQANKLSTKLVELNK